MLAAAFGIAITPGSLRPSVAAAPSLPGFVVPRREWNAHLPGSGLSAHRIDRITLHHTGPPAWYGVPPAPAYLRVIQSFHMGPERRWPDIAYHLLIDLDGAVWEGRSLAVAGDTATNYDPVGHAFVAVLGDYSLQHPNAAQRDAITATIRWLVDAYRVDAATLRGHRDYAATACPGDNLAVLLDEIRRLVAD
ncbi:MAG: peptidoglycan recognition family protein [Dehalococcoidia bacterium]